MKRLSVVLIGAGMRGQTYTQIMSDEPEKFEVVAVAEPVKGRRDKIKQTHNMKQQKLLIAAILLLATFFVAQAQRSITFEDVEKWQRITSRTISDDGKWIAATFAPWRGDSRVELYSADGKEKQSFSPVGECRFSSTSQHFIVKQKCIFYHLRLQNNVIIECNNFEVSFFLLPIRYILFHFYIL